MAFKPFKDPRAPELHSSVPRNRVFSVSGVDEATALATLLRDNQVRARALCLTAIRSIQLYQGFVLCQCVPAVAILSFELCVLFSLKC